MGCYNSCLVSAPVDDVWRTLRDFHDFSWAPDVMTQVDASGDKEQPGAKRVLNGVFKETLIELLRGHGIALSAAPATTASLTAAPARRALR